MHRSLATEQRALEAEARVRELEARVRELEGRDVRPFPDPSRPLERLYEEEEGGEHG